MNEFANLDRAAAEYDNPYTENPDPRLSRFFPASDLAGKPVPAREWLVRDLVPSGTVTLLGGDGGTGKSLLALQLACAVASGGKWMGRAVSSGGALFISAEDDTAELHRRLNDVVQADTERREGGADLETRSSQEWAEMMGRFELRQVVLALDEGRALSGQTAEIVQEMRNAGGYRGIPVPLDVLEQRNTVAADVPNPVQTRPIIDRLFPASVAAKLGVQTINIAQGSVEWPVATAGAIAGWAATEGANVPGPNPFQTAERALAPDHTLGAHMRITRKALKQAGEGLEQAVRRDMAAAIGAELDRAVLMGSGAGGEPLGIVPGAGVYGITSTAIGAAASWAAFRAEVVSFMEANAISTASGVNMAFEPAIWAELDDTLIAGTAVSEWDRLVKHIPAGNIALANQLDAGTAILTTSAGGVPPAFLGLWGGVDMIRDPYTDAQNGGLRLTGLLTADVTVARGLQTRILTGIGGV